jgi:hypothetical protein
MSSNIVKSAAMGCVAMFGIGLPSPIQAQNPLSGAAVRNQRRTLDQELLDGLHDTRPERLPSVPERQGDPAGSNPLKRIAELMRIVEGRLARHDTSPETQAIQRQIVAAAAKLRDWR